MIPTIGTPATIACGSDRNPYTVTSVDVSGPHPILTIRADDWRVVSGSEANGSAEYEYTSNLDGNAETFRWRNGRWESVRRNPDSGRWNKGGTYGSMWLGSRRRYYDPHF